MSPPQGQSAHLEALVQPCAHSLVRAIQLSRVKPSVSCLDRLHYSFGQAVRVRFPWEAAQLHQGELVACRAVKPSAPAWTDGGISDTPSAVASMTGPLQELLSHSHACGINKVVPGNSLYDRSHVTAWQVEQSRWTKTKLWPAGHRGGWHLQAARAVGWRHASRHCQQHT